MPFASNGVCFDTALQAASSMCASKFPQVEAIAATTTTLLSCVSVDQTGLSGAVVRLNLSRATTNAAPTAFSVQSVMPTCDPTTGGGLEFGSTFWVACFVVMALGVIAGQQR